MHIERASKADYGSYQASYDRVDEARKVVAEKYIAELIFMETQLGKLKEDIEENGCVDHFVQGAQSMLRESPSMKTYGMLIQRYADMQKKLADLMPEKKDATVTQAGEKLAAFVKKGKK